MERDAAPGAPTNLFSKPPKNHDNISDDYDDDFDDLGGGEDSKKSAHKDAKKQPASKAVQDVEEDNWDDLEDEWGDLDDLKGNKKNGNAA